MSRQPSEPRLSLPASVAKRVGLSVGVALALFGGNAYASMDVPNNARTQQLLAIEPDVMRVRMPDEQTNPQSSDSSVDRETLGQSYFGCEVVDGDYTVMYHPESQPGQAYAWATPTQLGGGWTPEMRCNEISRRLEAYRRDGLEELQTSVENNYDIICVTTQKNSDCRIVMTVPPGEDPVAIRDRVFRNLTIADSGQSTQPVSTFVGTGGDRVLRDILDVGESVWGGGNRQSLRSSGGINLRPFLDPADGGTGTRLIQSDR